jgi:threonine synthase
MARWFGLKAVAAPSAGNAGGALAAYAARAGMEAYLFMPRDTPKANIIECVATGAHVTLVDGLITDCGKEVTRRKEQEGWFDFSTLKEPYRLEGKKTLGFELAEQLHWELPDVVVYPTGGGTGLIRQSGWVQARESAVIFNTGAGNKYLECYADLVTG